MTLCTCKVIHFRIWSADVVYVQVSHAKNLIENVIPNQKKSSQLFWESFLLSLILVLLFTGRLETHIDNIEDCKRLARQCQLHDLIKEMEDAYKKQSSFGECAHRIDRGCTLCSKLFYCQIKCHHLMQVTVTFEQSFIFNLFQLMFNWYCLGLQLLTELEIVHLFVIYINLM